MCRLLGIVANKEVDLRFSLFEGPKTLSSLSRKHADGWGLGWYEEGHPRVVKKPHPACESNLYRQTAAEANSRIFVAHVRKSTGTPREEMNCHPFQHRRWLFAHNGAICRETLLEWLDQPHRLSVHGDTDSEVYFHWMLQNIEKSASTQEGIAAALKKVKSHRVSYTGLNFLLSDGESLYAYRDASKAPNYYSLFWLRRKRGPLHPQTLHSKETAAMLESKTLNGEDAILVCSERLTEEAWQEIPLGHLFTVGPELNPVLIPL